jgi:hypothetical protein
LNYWFIYWIAVFGAVSVISIIGEMAQSNMNLTLIAWLFPQLFFLSFGSNTIAFWRIH